MRRVLAALGLATTASIVLAATPLPAQERATGVRVDAVRVEPFSQTVPIIGRLVAVQRGEVAARVSGAVQAIDVDVGDRVEAGDILALIDEERLLARAELVSARVQGAEARIAAEQAELDLARQERARLERLRTSAAFSPAALADKDREIQIILARLAGAEAQHAEALADLALAGQDLRDARVAAPFQGIVTRKYVNVGAFVQAGEPVLVLLDDTSLEIEADVPSAQARPLDPGTVVEAALDGGERIRATLRAVVPDENPLTRTQAVRLELDRSTVDRLVASGETVTIEVPIGAVRDVVTVSKDAVLRRGPGDVVFVAEDGMARMRNVQLGEAVADRFVVRQGLEPGDLVVVRGNERLRPEQAISYEPPQTSAMPGGEADRS
ncbi:MAG: efflux RND transporter periplasmic adaptor subunit [Pseudomonadota bacterium]